MDFQRYIRNIQLDGFSEIGQNRLSESGVFIVGAGALGSVAAMYLAGSGVGKIAVADFDNIDITNLQRQVFYSESETGKGKAHAIADRMRALNSGIEVIEIRRLITPALAEELFAGYDVILECSDNPSTKSLVVGTGRKLGIPVVVGGVREYSGQIMVFTASSPEYTDLFPAPECNGFLPCGTSGVFGPVPGIVASIQASETIKILAGLPGVLKDTLITFDVRTMEFQKFSF